MQSQAFNYTRIQSRCIAAISRAGQPCVIRRLGVATGDEWNPTAGAPSLIDVTGVSYRPRLQPREGSLIDNEFLRVIVLPEDGLVINQDDRFAVNIVSTDVVSSTEFLEISDVQKFSPGGVVLYWELELRT